MTVFEFDDYKDYFRALIKIADKRGFQSLLAEAAQCQRAFISQILNGSVHLTIDHATGISQFLRHSNLEADYFVELVSFARAGTESTRVFIRRRMKTLKQQNGDLGKKFSKAAEAPKALQARYYSNWRWTAIHVLSSIPAFQTADAIASTLGLTVSAVDEVLIGLREMGIVSTNGKGRWKPTMDDVFLPRDSAMTFANHWNWRLKGLEDIQSGNVDSLHYTTLHALSRRDAVKLRNGLMEFITSSRKIVAPSPEEEMICFTCDFFKLS